jgi:hypothetical protein
MSQTAFGTAVGLVLGLVIVFAGFGPMLIVALFGIGGWAVTRILAGELDLGNLSSMTQQWRNRR